MVAMMPVLMYAEEEWPEDFHRAVNEAVADSGYDIMAVNVTAEMAEIGMSALKTYIRDQIVISCGKPSVELIQAGVPICPGPSVAQVLGTPHGLEQLRRSLRLWKMMVDGTVEDPFYQYDLVEPQLDRQGTSLKDYRKRFAYYQAECRKLDYIVVDIETSGDIRQDEPEDTELISVAVLFPRPDGYQIAVWTDDALNDPYCRTRLAMILTSGVCLVGHNCFTGNTEIHTRQGIERLDKLVGQEPEVWTRMGWIKSQIGSFGIQKTQRVTFRHTKSRYTKEVTYEATPNHRWILRDGSVTTDIRVGDVVPALLPEIAVDETSDAFRHGLVFADGTKTRHANRYQLRLCGWKAKYANLFSNVTYPTSCGGDPQAYIKSEIEMKQLPPSDSSPQYIADFIAGWITFDGTIRGNRNTADSIVVTTVNKANADWLEANAANGGWLVVGASTHPMGKTGYPSSHEEFHLVTLTSSTVGRYWTVKSIEPGAEAEVFCPVVPGEAAFTLADGVYTGNCQFDVKWLNNRLKAELQGQVVKPGGDTLLLHYAQFPGATGNHGLKALCQRLLGAPEWESGLRQYTIEGGHYERIPGNMLYAYNAGDSYWTWKLYELLLAWLAQGPEGPRKLYHDLLIPATRMLVDIESTDAGWPVDLPLLLEQQVIHQAKTAKQLAKFRMAVGDPTPFLSEANAKQRAAWLAKGTPLRESQHEFNPASWQQIQKYLHSLGIEVDSTDEETLTELVRSGTPRKVAKFITRLLDYRHTAKMDQNYISGVLRKQRYGSARPRFNLAGTVTGRLASWIHTVPRITGNNGEDAIYRRVYTAGHLERCIIGLDYGQIETRIVAEVSGDPQMIDDLQEGRDDFFAVLMPGCFPRTFRSFGQVMDLKAKDFQHYDLLRNQVKPISHGANYKRQPPAMAKQLGIPLKDAYTMFNSYMERYSMLRPWQESIMPQVRGEVIDPQWGVPGLWTPFGRRFQQGVITKKNGWSVENAAVAFVPQSAGSDICLTAALKIHEQLHLYDARLVNTQHDALYAIAPRQYAEAVSNLMEREMRAAAKTVFDRVPFIVKPKIGANWAEV